ncbi:MAG TPA: hypothetical protein VNR90_09800, partial [Vicinamibacterales bacterium]|nr:hypothetical protein [Vicinamibacterales bacterium]
MKMTFGALVIVLSGCVAAGPALAQTAPSPATAPAAAPTTAPAQTAPPARPSAPTRDPKTPGYITATHATELPDGAVPPPDKSGNFVLGPAHPPAPEMTDQDGVPHGLVHTFMMDSSASAIYPGIARVAGTRPELDPANPAKRIVQSGPA